MLPFNWSFLPGSTNRMIFKWISIKTILLCAPLSSSFNYTSFKHVFLFPLDCVCVCVHCVLIKWREWARSEPRTRVTTIIHLSSLVAVIRVSWALARMLLFFSRKIPFRQQFQNQISLWLLIAQLLLSSFINAQ